jgi:uncharacterized protein with ATP-grasp and redox domains
VITRMPCLPCIIDDLVGALDLMDVDEELQVAIAKRCLEFLRDEFRCGDLPSYYITYVHREIKRGTGNPIPFKELRAACNVVGMELAAQLEGRLDGMRDEAQFVEAAKWAVVANHLDFRTAGIGYGFKPSDIEGMLREKLRAGFPVDDSDRLYDLCHAAKKVLYIPDNVGELAFDKVMVRILRGYGAEVVVALRGGPITSDATLEDGEVVGISEVASEVISAGPDTLGISWKEKSPELEDALDWAEVVVTKGQANFYAMYTYRDRIPGHIATLFRSKCDVVASLFGHRGKINIISLLK